MAEDRQRQNVVDLETLKTLTPMERAVVLLLAFTGEDYAPQALARLLEGSFDKPTAQTMKDVETALKAKGLPVMSVRKHGNPFLRWDGQLSLDAARALVEAADTLGWWPTARAFAEVADLEQPVYYRGKPDITAGTRWVGQLRFMRFFILGSDAGAQAEDWDVFNRLRQTACNAAAWQLTEILDDTPEFAPKMGRILRDALLLPWLNAAFVRGRDVRPVLRTLAAEMAAGVKIGPHLQHVYLALCAWTGWREGFDAMRRQVGDGFVEGCRAVCAGDFPRADSILRKIWEPKRYETGKDFDNLPERLLLHAVCMAAKPGKTRTGQLLKGYMAEEYSYSYFGVPRAAHRYRQYMRDFSDAWGGDWARVFNGGGESVLKHMETLPADVPNRLMLAWTWHALLVGRTAQAEKAAACARGARELLARGYVNLAGLFLSLTVGACAEAEVQEAVDAVSEQGAWLLPRVAPEPEWKALVKLLRDEVAKSKKAEGLVAAADPTRRLVWEVEINERASGCCDVSLIQPVAYSGEIGKRGFKRVELDGDDLAKKRNAELMNADDRLLLRILESAYDGWRDDWQVTKPAVEQLCRMKNLALAEDSLLDDEDDEELAGGVGAPVVFENQPCAFESVVREDGGVTLAVPPWLADVREGYVVRRLGKGRYAYVPVTAGATRLANFFAQYGVKGRFVIPQEGMAAAADVLAEITDVVPLANPAQADGAELPRVTGASACAVRLDFVDGVLAVRVVVRPFADNPALVLEPGCGTPEKLVSGAAGSYWLVRDLAAERANLGVIRAAIPGAEAWFDGRAAWTIEDIAVALETLVALKALEPPVPLEWMDERRLRVTAAPKHGAKLDSSRSAEEWFSVKGSFALDDGRVLSVFDLMDAMSTREGRYVRLSDGDYVALTASMAREMEALASVGRRKGDALEVSRAALPMLDRAFGEADDALPLPGALAAGAAEIRAVLRRKPKVPGALRADLRPYQTEGFAWLSRLAACGFGACLADDMGLGKTLQVIALLLERAADGASLVVAPASVCGNWRSEINRFAPTLNPVLAFERAEGPFADLKAGDVLIASYGYLLFHEKEFVEAAWNGVVLDEAQAIKNDASKRAHLVKRLRGRFRVAATGTPVENHLGELWSVFDFLNPGLLGTAGAFGARFTQGGKAAPALKRIVKPLILRRLKGDVLDDLPEKTEVTIPVVLGRDERSAYEGCRLHALAALEAGGVDEKNRFSILAELTRLRRFCCHPSLVLGEGSVPSAKMEALVELLETLHQGQHKALVFSQFTDYLAIVRRVVDAHGWRALYLDGATPVRERGRLVDEFQTGEAEFFLISLKAGGTGLNLTAANYVVLLDPWWNPAVENQAADRVHRIGQKQPVTVYRLVASDTVEERVIELHREKKAMAADLLEGTAKSALTPADLIKLFQ